MSRVGAVSSTGRLGLSVVVCFACREHTRPPFAEHHLACRLRSPPHRATFGRWRVASFSRCEQPGRIANASASSEWRQVRQPAVFTFRGKPMVATGVDLTIEGWSVERILRERMWSRSTSAMTTAGELRSAGCELGATSAAPHYSVVLPAPRLLRGSGCQPPSLLQVTETVGAQICGSTRQ
jgi:hypothetical protein